MYLNINFKNNESITLIIVKSRDFKYYVAQYKSKDIDCIPDINLLTKNPFNSMLKAIDHMVDFVLKAKDLLIFKYAKIKTENQGQFNHVIYNLKKSELINCNIDEDNLSATIELKPKCTYGKNNESAEKIYWRFNL